MFLQNTRKLNHQILHGIYNNLIDYNKFHFSRHVVPIISVTKWRKTMSLAWPELAIGIPKAFDNFLARITNEFEEVAVQTNRVLFEQTLLWMEVSYTKLYYLTKFKFLRILFIFI